MSVTIHHDDCREIIATLPECSVDAIVTDPPYELGFMGKRWDASGIAYDTELWAECLRVLKPGGHLLAFGGTRTYHRMTVAIEDAGFEIRDSIHWLYGSGFPKSHDVSKGIDKAAGAERVTKKWKERSRVGVFAKDGSDVTSTSGNLECPTCNKWKFALDYCKCPRDSGPATDAARQWEGWGTALKPAHEPIVVARKPLAGTVAANVMKHGTGALNINGTRVRRESGDVSVAGHRTATFGTQDTMSGGDGSGGWSQNNAGRWPANLVITHAADCGDDCADGCPVAELDRQSGNLKSGAREAGTYAGKDDGPTFGRFGSFDSVEITASSGGASRFFTVTEWDDITPFLYVAKPSRSERNAGLDALPESRRSTNYGAMKTRKCNVCGSRTNKNGRWPDCPHNDWSWQEQLEVGHKGGNAKNTHPTVKPLALMRHLVRLVTPPGGTVLEPFAGSGTTLAAAILEGFNAIGCELTDDYLPIIEGRVAWAQSEREKMNLNLFGDAA